ncbi:hypothetical protein B0I26_10892 [Anoxybacillus vitaminiphilus]|uniref:Uncharacterized protein n=1 Tax=Paranoxybacillus vitaminiphilus TaxID=581036 RepID=A0A327YEJ3_9BACL|nr:hypothetical protein B0I26_10892 [Anoxybacillus vitaminiphilus]
MNKRTKMFTYLKIYLLYTGLGIIFFIAMISEFTTNSTTLLKSLSVIGFISYLIMTFLVIRYTKNTNR